MEQYSRILVALDLTEADNYIVDYLYTHRAQWAQGAELYFLHVEKDLTLPIEVEKDSTSPGDEAVLDAMRACVSKVTDDEQFTSQCHYITVEGDVADQMHHWASVKKADLVVLGQKEHEHGSGLAANKFARRSHCDLLFLPSSKMKLQKILVPIDFSAHSRMAFERAVQLAGNHGDITCLNVYTVHAGYSKIGKTYEEMAEIMKGHAERELNSFVGSFDGELDTLSAETALAHNHDFAHVILNQCIDREMDLVVMGSKGQTFVSWMLLGSVAENTILLSVKVPLLVVKQKDENFGFWQAIKEI